MDHNASVYGTQCRPGGRASPRSPFFPRLDRELSSASIDSRLRDNAIPSSAHCRFGDLRSSTGTPVPLRVDLLIIRKYYFCIIDPRSGQLRPISSENRQSPSEDGLPGPVVSSYGSRENDTGSSIGNTVSRLLSRFG